MKVRIKKLNENAVIPQYAKSGDAGLDLTCTDFYYEDEDCCVLVVKSGLAIEIPVGYVGLLFPRSSIVNTKLRLSNCVGVIDSGYRGELMCKFDTLKPMVESDYKIGDRFAQLIIIPYPSIELEEVDELSDSERGVNGYGSSNNDMLVDAA